MEKMDMYKGLEMKIDNNFKIVKAVIFCASEQ